MNRATLRLSSWPPIVAAILIFTGCSPAPNPETGSESEPESQVPLWALEPDDGSGPDATALDRTIAEFPGHRLIYPSPDGRYAISWPDRAASEAVNYEVTNHLIDLQTGKSIDTVAEEDGDFEGRNHGGMRVLWRADSRAFVYRLEGKWAPRWVGLIEIDAEGKVRNSSLTHPVGEAFADLLRKEAADIWHEPTDIHPSELLDCDIACAFDDAGTRLAIQGRCEMNPKQIPGSTYAAAELTGTYDLRTRQLSVTSRKLTEARVVKEEE